MQIFRNRPLALSVCVAALVVLLAYRISGIAKLCLIVGITLILLAVSVYCVLRKRIGRNRLLAMLCLGVTLLLLIPSYLFLDLRYETAQEWNGSTLDATGYVTERQSSDAFYSSFLVHLESVNQTDCDINAVLECEYASALQLGDRFRITATARPFSDEDDFHERTYYLSEGCLNVLTLSSHTQCEILEEPQQNALIWCKKLNEQLSFRLQNAIGNKQGDLSAALLLGDRNGLDDKTTLEFQRAGISHLLALSGLHVAILIGFLELLLRICRCPLFVKAIFIPLSALGYLALTGFALSTQRAVLMVCVLYLGNILRADYDSFTALCAALAVILILSPNAVLDLSLWMSFLAAGSIIIFSPTIYRAINESRRLRALPSLLFSAIRALLTAISVGVIANLALMLLCATAFGSISLASVLATLVLSIPVTLMIILSLFCLILPIPPLTWLCQSVGSVILLVGDRFSDIPNILLPTVHPAVIVLLAGMSLAMILLAVLPPCRNKWISCLVPALCVLAITTSAIMTYTDTRLTHTTVKAGFGEVYLDTQGGKAVLINNTRGNAAPAYEISKAATEAGCTEIQDLVFCRYYNQGTYFISKFSSRLCIRKLHLPSPTNEQEQKIALRLEQEAALHEIDVIYDAESFFNSQP